MHKRHCNMLAEACQSIEQGLEAQGVKLPQCNDIMELVIARIGLACAKDNDKFDSFKFAEASRADFARRAIDAGGAPRSRNVPVSQRSKP
jgi:hypothetical protein